MEEKKLTGYPSVDKPWLKYYSEEAINTPLPECTIYEYLWERNKDYLSATALRYFGRKFSFRELFENIDKAANAFASLGLKKGDIIIMATATIPETVYALYGLNKIGAIPNMVDPRTSAEGIRDYILEVDAKVVMTLDIAYDRIADAVRGTNVDTIIVASPGDSLPPVKRAMYKALNKLKGISPALDKWSYSWTRFIADGQQDIAQSIPYEKDTCCVIVHTGGTTGSPKGVMLSNDNVNALAVQSILTGIDMTREHVQYARTLVAREKMPGFPEKILRRKTNKTIVGINHGNPAKLLYYRVNFVYLQLKLSLTNRLPVHRTVARSRLDGIDTFIFFRPK